MILLTVANMENVDVDCTIPGLKPVYEHDRLSDKPWKRWVALIFVVIAVFFYSANYDMPGSMEKVIERTFDVSTYEFEFMYCVYVLPNGLLCFFSGLMIDRVLGLSRSSILFAAIALVGQIVTTAGGFYVDYWLLVIGRAVYGIGAESIILSLTIYVIIWFKGRELCFTFGLILSFIRLGSFFSYSVSTPLYNSVDGISPGRSFGISTTLFLIMNTSMVISLMVLSHFSNKNIKSKRHSDEEITHQDLVTFHPIYWVIVTMLSVTYSAVVGFILISQLFLEKKYKTSEQDANQLIALFNLITAIVSPLSGLLVDYVGKDIYFNFFGILVGVISQIVVLFTTWNSLVPLVLYSIFFSILYSCAWSLVARTVKPYQLGTAYGILSCFTNIFQSLDNILGGVLMQYYGANGISTLILGCLVVGFICCFLIWLLDKLNKGPLNLSAAERAKFQEATRQYVT